MGRAAGPDDDPPAPRASFQLVESKLHPPPARRGMVPRTALVDRLSASPSPSVICVVAPAGYGKTTLLAQWAQRKGDCVAWVEIDPSDNDPVVLLTYIAVALDRVEPIDPQVFRALAAPGASIVATVVPQLAAAMAAMHEPVALVLDHTELLGDQQCMDAVAELAVRLPTGTQLLLATRTRPPLPVGRLRAQGLVVEVGVQELAMDVQEAELLLKGAEVDVTGVDVGELLRRTEGWPVGLYLAALAHKASSPRRTIWGEFAGDHRLVAGYLWSELLGRLPDQTLAFLIRTSVLDRMSGPLCDAVLDATSSIDALESLESSNLLVVPLDRHRQWYRYHHLFHEFLRAELERREPELVPQLHARAAAWYEANGLPETAIAHAQAAGDTDRLAELVWHLGRATYASGRVETTRRWFGWFEDQGLLERYPQLAVLGALLQTLLGRRAEAERWAATGERGLAAGGLPQASTMEAWRANLRVFMCPDGLERMRADVELVRESFAAGDPVLAEFRAPMLLHEGVSYLLEGHADQADPILAHAVDVATEARAVPAASAALAERAVVAIERHQWSEAQTLAGRALDMVQAGNLNDYITTALVQTVAARTALHRGDIAQAQQHLGRAARLRPLLTSAMPHLAVQTLLELARAYLTLDDTAGARTVLRQAMDVLRVRPSLGTLPEQARRLQEMLDSSRGGTVRASSLSTAELRLLPLLATHLSFREMGERLHVSRHTVKSQALSVYRKLGVSSRSQAVQRMQELGLGG